MRRRPLALGAAFALPFGGLTAAALLLGTLAEGWPEAASAQAPRGRVALPGFNMSGAEFAPGRIPGRAGKDYVYPKSEAIRAYVRAGAKALRLPVRWERLQPALGGELDAAEARRIDDVVRVAEGEGALLILDVHNYARFRQRLVTDPEVGAGLADLWTRLARRYRDREVAFGLMNEPHGIGAREWRGVADRALAAIRSTGARNLVLVPGTRWTGAHSWSAGGPASNAAALTGLRDANVAIEMHQYLDRNSSGGAFDCPGGPREAVRRLEGATRWLRANRLRGFLGEFAAGRSAPCQEALAALLDHMDANSDVWLGWTYWTVGPWWPAHYEFSVEPRGGALPDGATALKGYFGRR